MSVPWVQVWGRWGSCGWTGDGGFGKIVKKLLKEKLCRPPGDRFPFLLSRTCDEIRPDYRHVESCQETVPEAITAFLEGEDFEDVIRTAVSLVEDEEIVEKH